MPNTNNPHKRIKAAGCLIVLSLTSILMACSSENKEGIYVPEESEIVITETEETEENIIVEIKGEVEKPGVYTMDPGSRLNDLLIISGGASAQANLRSVNLAMKITDGDSFYIPSQEEEADVSAEISVIVGGSESDGKIDLNRATREELMSVTGIGPSTADNILAYREEKGRFESVDDLINVNRIGEKTLEKLRDFFIVK